MFIGIGVGVNVLHGGAPSLTAPIVAAQADLEGNTVTISVVALSGSPTPTVALTALTLDSVDVLANATGTGPWVYTAPSASVAQTVAWTVTATNSVDSDTASGVTVVPVAPAQMDAPTVTGGSGRATVTLAADPDDGGAEISSYDWQLTLAADTGFADPVAVGTEAIAVVEPLAPGSYIARSRAVNIAGAGPWSATSAAATVTGPMAAATTPNTLAELLTNAFVFGVASDAGLTAAVTGGTAPITYVITGRPAGVVDDGDGSVSGVPSTAGETGTLTLTATDATGAVVTVSAPWQVPVTRLTPNPVNPTLWGQVTTTGPVRTNLDQEGIYSPVLFAAGSNAAVFHGLQTGPIYSATPMVPAGDRMTVHALVRPGVGNKARMIISHSVDGSTLRATEYSIDFNLSTLTVTAASASGDNFLVETGWRNAIALPSGDIMLSVSMIVRTAGTPVAVQGVRVRVGPSATVEGESITILAAQAVRGSLVPSGWVGGDQAEAPVTALLQDEAVFTPPALFTADHIVISESPPTTWATSGGTAAGIGGNAIRLSTTAATNMLVMASPSLSPSQHVIVRAMVRGDQATIRLRDVTRDVASVATIPLPTGTITDTNGNATSARAGTFLGTPTRTALGGGWWLIEAVHECAGLGVYEIGIGTGSASAATVDIITGGIAEAWVPRTAAQIVAEDPLPTSYIFVHPTLGNNATGIRAMVSSGNLTAAIAAAQAAPVQTILRARELCRAGCCVILASGTSGSPITHDTPTGPGGAGVVFGPTEADGTLPIWVVGASSDPAATIVRGAVGANAATQRVLSLTGKKIRVHNFTVLNRATNPGGGGDATCIFGVGSITRAGHTGPFADDHLVAGVKFTGDTFDALKWVETDGVRVFGCDFPGGSVIETGTTLGTQEVSQVRDNTFDMVTCFNVEVAYNRWSGKQRNALTMKAWSWNLYFHHNEVSHQWLRAWWPKINGFFAGIAGANIGEFGFSNDGINDGAGTGRDTPKNGRAWPFGDGGGAWGELRNVLITDNLFDATPASVSVGSTGNIATWQRMGLAFQSGSEARVRRNFFGGGVTQAATLRHADNAYYRDQLAFVGGVWTVTATVPAGLGASVVQTSRQEAGITVPILRTFPYRVSLDASNIIGSGVAQFVVHPDAASQVLATPSNYDITTAATTGVVGDLPADSRRGLAGWDRDAVLSHVGLA